MKNENFNIDIEITAKFKVNSAIDRETLNEVFNGDLMRYVKESLLDDESLFCVAEDEYEVISIKEAKNRRSQKY